MPTTTISLVLFRSHFVVDKNDVNSGRYIVKEIRVLPEISGII
jgi:hypothetical protein